MHHVMARLQRTNQVVLALVDELHDSERLRLASFAQYKSALDTRFGASKAAVAAERLLVKYFDDGSNRYSDLKRKAQDLASEPMPKATRSQPVQ